MFAKRLQGLRKDKGLTQKQFAEKFGIAGGTIAMWETGKREPDFKTTERLADFFNVSVDYLLGRDERKRVPVSEDGQEISYDDFTYAMYQEGRTLTRENKEKLLELARFFQEQQSRQ